MDQDDTRTACVHACNPGSKRNEKRQSWDRFIHRSHVVPPGVEYLNPRPRCAMLMIAMNTRRIIAEISPAPAEFRRSMGERSSTHHSAWDSREIVNAMRGRTSRASPRQRAGFDTLALVPRDQRGFTRPLSRPPQRRPATLPAPHRRVGLIHRGAGNTPREQRGVDIDQLSTCVPLRSCRGTTGRVLLSYPTASPVLVQRHGSPGAN